jgi:flagellar basal body-associated protein FliL
MMAAATPQARSTARGKKPRSGRLTWKLAIILAAAAAALSGGVVYWHSRLWPAPSAIGEHNPEPPSYLELKPFVVTIANSAGIPHFVEVGVNLAFATKDTGAAIATVLPEVQDTLRATVLGFKVDDVMTPAGVDKLREEMVAALNRLFLKRFGTAEVRRLTGSASRDVVANLYFSTLIVE